MSDETEIYRQIIFEHYKNPLNKGVLDPCSCSASGTNKICGDKVTIFIQLKDDKIEQITFDGEGCAISQASASLLTNYLKGLTITEALMQKNKVMDLIYGKDIAGVEELGDIIALSGVKEFPDRIQCAELAWVVFEKALKK